ncbi:putative mak10 subunit [Erysiphe necator]|uniref:Putative mak10 subunit n=1 Tax=Uncinula necator TaxID=52586 RepID=A0A0B1P9L9_UNCNE|nr:putative mak10 subunit [Erysiphe necator]
MSTNSVNSVVKEIEVLDINNTTREFSSTCTDQSYTLVKIKSRGVIATDITEQFISAVQLLDAGQIIQDSNFTLFESVGALEIMNKKMDTGYLELGETMEDNYDFSKELLPEEVIGIIDQLLSHEMAWHMGHPLAQTIFTSLHIDRILHLCTSSINEAYFDQDTTSERLMHRTLRAYCFGLIKTCCYVYHRINAEHFYEEEDFVSHTFNRNLLKDIELTSILSFMEETINLVTSSETDSKYRTALHSRLQFRVEFLTAVENADLRSFNPKFTIWKNLILIISELEKTAFLGTQVPSAFSEKLQRKLASTVPPRPIVQIQAEDALNHLKKMCLDISILTQVLEYYDCHSLLTFILMFQARKPQPSTYVRALLQHYIFGETFILGNLPIRQVIDENLATTVLPGNLLLKRENDEIELPSDPRHKIANQMEIFRSRAIGSYLEMLRTLCQNRCRIRRSLCHTIVDWDNLQLDAEVIDRNLQDLMDETPIFDLGVSSDPMWSFPLSSWAYYYKICQMEWIVQLGFELETYQPNELAGMYWYLSFLGRKRFQHVERMRKFVNWSYCEAHKNCSITPDSYTELSEALHFLKIAKLSLTATCNFANALSSLFTALGRLSLIKSPPQPYSDDSLRYEARMKPFTLISLPEFIPFDEFTKFVTQPDEKTLNLLNQATKSATEAKKAIEEMSKLSPKESYCRGSDESWIKDIKNTLKACIFTKITISNITNIVKASGNSNSINLTVEIPKPENRYHYWWIVPIILSDS